MRKNEASFFLLFLLVWPTIFALPKPQQTNIEEHEQVNFVDGLDGPLEKRIHETLDEKFDHNPPLKNSDLLKTEELDLFLHTANDTSSHKPLFTLNDLKLKRKGSIPIFSPIEIFQITRDEISSSKTPHSSRSSPKPKPTLITDVEPSLSNLSSRPLNGQPKARQRSSPKPQKVIFQRVPVVIEIVDKTKRMDIPISPSLDDKVNQLNENLVPQASLHSRNSQQTIHQTTTVTETVPTTDIKIEALDVLTTESPISETTISTGELEELEDLLLQNDLFSSHQTSSSIPQNDEISPIMVNSENNADVTLTTAKSFENIITELPLLIEEETEFSPQTPDITSVTEEPSKPREIIQEITPPSSLIESLSSIPNENFPFPSPQEPKYFNDEDSENITEIEESVMSSKQTFEASTVNAIIANEVSSTTSTTIAPQITSGSLRGSKSNNIRRPAIRRRTRTQKQRERIRKLRLKQRSSRRLNLRRRTFVRPETKNTININVRQGSHPQMMKSDETNMPVVPLSTRLQQLNQSEMSLDKSVNMKQIEIEVDEPSNKEANVQSQDKLINTRVKAKVSLSTLLQQANNTVGPISTDEPEVTTERIENIIETTIKPTISLSMLLQTSNTTEVSIPKMEEEDTPQENTIIEKPNTSLPSVIQNFRKEESLPQKKITRKNKFDTSLLTNQGKSIDNIPRRIRFGERRNRINHPRRGSFDRRKRIRPSFRRRRPTTTTTTTSKPDVSLFIFNQTENATDITDSAFPVTFTIVSSHKTVSVSSTNEEGEQITILENETPDKLSIIDTHLIHPKLSLSTKAAPKLEKPESTDNETQLLPVKEEDLITSTLSSLFDLLPFMNSDPKIEEQSTTVPPSLETESTTLPTVIDDESLSYTTQAPNKTFEAEKVPELMPTKTPLEDTDELKTSIQPMTEEITMKSITKQEKHKFTTPIDDQEDIATTELPKEDMALSKSIVEDTIDLITTQMPEIQEPSPPSIDNLNFLNMNDTESVDLDLQLIESFLALSDLQEKAESKIIHEKPMINKIDETKTEQSEGISIIKPTTELPINERLEFTTAEQEIEELSVTESVTEFFPDTTEGKETSSSSKDSSRLDHFASNQSSDAVELAEISGTSPDFIADSGSTSLHEDKISEVPSISLSLTKETPTVHETSPIFEENVVQSVNSTGIQEIADYFDYADVSLNLTVAKVSNNVTSEIVNMLNQELETLDENLTNVDKVFPDQIDIESNKIGKSIDSSKSSDSQIIQLRDNKGKEASDQIMPELSVFIFTGFSNSTEQTTIPGNSTIFMKPKNHTEKNSERIVSPEMLGEHSANLAKGSVFEQVATTEFIPILATVTSTSKETTTESSFTVEQITELSNVEDSAAEIAGKTNDTSIADVDSSSIITEIVETSDRAKIMETSEPPLDSITSPPEDQPSVTEPTVESTITPEIEMTTEPSSDLMSIFNIEDLSPDIQDLILKAAEEIITTTEVSSNAVFETTISPYSETTEDFTTQLPISKGDEILKTEPNISLGMTTSSPEIETTPTTKQEKLSGKEENEIIANSLGKSIDNSKDLPHNEQIIENNVQDKIIDKISIQTSISTQEPPELTTFASPELEQDTTEITESVTEVSKSSIGGDELLSSSDTETTLASIEITTLNPPPVDVTKFSSDIIQRELPGVFQVLLAQRVIKTQELNHQSSLSDSHLEQNESTKENTSEIITAQPIITTSKPASAGDSQAKLVVTDTPRTLKTDSVKKDKEIEISQKMKDMVTKAATTVRKELDTSTLVLPSLLETQTESHGSIVQRLLEELLKSIVLEKLRDPSIDKLIDHHVKTAVSFHTDTPVNDSQLTVDLDVVSKEQNHTEADQVSVTQNKISSQTINALDENKHQEKRTKITHFVKEDEHLQEAIAPQTQEHQVQTFIKPKTPNESHQFIQIQDVAPAHIPKHTQDILLAEGEKLLQENEFLSNRIGKTLLDNPRSHNQVTKTSQQKINVGSQVKISQFTEPDSITKDDTNKTDTQGDKLRGTIEETLSLPGDIIAKFLPTENGVPQTSTITLLKFEEPSTNNATSTFSDDSISTISTTTISTSITSSAATKLSTTTSTTSPVTLSAATTSRSTTTTTSPTTTATTSPTPSTSANDINTTNPSISTTTSFESSPTITAKTAITSPSTTESPILDIGELLRSFRTKVAQHKVSQLDTVSSDIKNPNSEHSQKPSITNIKNIDDERLAIKEEFLVTENPNIQVEEMLLTVEAAPAVKTTINKVSMNVVPAIKEETTKQSLMDGIAEENIMDVLKKTQDHMQLTTMPSGEILIVPNNVAQKVEVKEPLLNTEIFVTAQIEEQQAEVRSTLNEPIGKTNMLPQTETIPQSQIASENKEQNINPSLTENIMTIKQDSIFSKVEPDQMLLTDSKTDQVQQHVVEPIFGEKIVPQPIAVAVSLSQMETEVQPDIPRQKSNKQNTEQETISTQIDSANPDVEATIHPMPSTKILIPLSLQKENLSDVHEIPVTNKKSLVNPIRVPISKDLKKVEDKTKIIEISDEKDKKQLLNHNKEFIVDSEQEQVKGHTIMENKDEKKSSIISSGSSFLKDEADPSSTKTINVSESASPIIEVNKNSKINNVISHITPIGVKSELPGPIAETEHQHDPIIKNIQQIDTAQIDNLFPTVFNPNDFVGTRPSSPVISKSLSSVSQLPASPTRQTAPKAPIAETLFNAAQQNQAPISQQPKASVFQPNSSPFAKSLSTSNAQTLNDFFSFASPFQFAPSPTPGVSLSFTVGSNAPPASALNHFGLAPAPSPSISNNGHTNNNQVVSLASPSGSMLFLRPNQAQHFVSQGFGVPLNHGRQFTHFG